MVKTVGVTAGKSSTNFELRKIFPLVFLLGVVACGHDRIPNTDVEDNADNREIVSFVEQYRRAIEQRNVARLLSLASRRYYDDNGTPGGEDDIDYNGLRTVLAQFRESVLDVRYEIRYRRVTFRNDRVLIDYTYTGSFRMATPEGERWARRLADNRLVLVKEDGKYRVLSGM